MCGKITAKLTETFTDGIAVVYNDNVPTTEAGTYICLQCSLQSYFYNYDSQLCMKCDQDVSGCKDCDINGVCKECEEGYVL